MQKFLAFINMSDHSLDPTMLQSQLKANLIDDEFLIKLRPLIPNKSYLSSAVEVTTIGTKLNFLASFLVTTSPFNSIDDWLNFENDENIQNHIFESLVNDPKYIVLEEALKEVSNNIGFHIPVISFKVNELQFKDLKDDGVLTFNGNLLSDNFVFQYPENFWEKDTLVKFLTTDSTITFYDEHEMTIELSTN